MRHDAQVSASLLLRWLTFTFTLGFGILAHGQDQPADKYVTVTDIAYRSGAGMSEGMRERCKLDIYYPEHGTRVPAIVWFHGGGLTSGQKQVPPELKSAGVIVIAPNYRLSPDVRAPEYIEDAAAAVAWAFANVERYGGSNQLIFVSGHSAGGYLTAMIGLDKRWLTTHQIDADVIAGLVPISGQAITHFTVRAERGIPELQPIIDDLAPLYHIRKQSPPFLIITGDRDRELLGRYEEAAYFWRMLKEAGHPHVELLELEGFDHGGMLAPALPRLLAFVRDRAHHINSR
ncbi:MAG TPA: alpha/beta hydrolase [Pirellulaceae bacterium]|mgnify:CR=1 FL=1|nr:alpha/beta hydrolase [Pirellulaceae bacterium]